MKRVWVDGWQLECCGVPFSTGSKVSWKLKPVDRNLLETILGGSEAARITHAEEHHGDEVAGGGRVVGVVRRIHAVFCRYELPTPEAIAMTPVRFSGVVRQRRVAEGREPPDDDRRFLGYIVDLDSDAGR